MNSWKSAAAVFVASIASLFLIFYGSPTVVAQGGSEVPEPETCHVGSYLTPTPVFECPSGGLYVVDVDCAHTCMDQYLSDWQAAIDKDCADGMAAKQVCVDAIAQCKVNHPDLSSREYKACKKAALDAYLAALDANHAVMMASLTQIQATFDACAPDCCILVED